MYAWETPDDQHRVARYHKCERCGGTFKTVESSAPTRREAMSRGELAARDAARN